MATIRYHNDMDLEYYQQKLIQRQNELMQLEDTQEASSQTVELDQSRVGRLSRMDALQGQAMSLEAKRRRQIEMQRIQSALIRIENGEYGYCLRCEEAIDPKRLDFDASATLCINCAEQA